MNKFIDVLAALDAGKLPDHAQSYEFLQFLKTDVISEAAGLSPQGKLLADQANQVLSAYQALGEHKNKDNLLQEALWHLSQADLKAVDVGEVNVDTDQAAQDLRNLATSLRTILSILWSGVSSETSSLFSDFTSFTRLALADAAEAVEGQAARAKESLRQVDAEVQQGQRDTLGRDKERLKQEEDVKVAFQHGMDTAKDAGTSVIGTAQDASAKAADLSERTSAQLQNSFYRMCERAQKDEEYCASINNLLDTVQKWLTKGFNATADSLQATSIDSLVDDPSPEQHVPKALRAIETLVARIAHMKDESLSPLVSPIRQCAADIRKDPALRTWFDEFFTYFRRALEDVGYAGSEEAKATRKDLRTRWREMLDADSDVGRAWKKDVEAMKVEVTKFWEGVKGDQDLNRVREAHNKLGEAIQKSLVEAGKQVGSEAQTGLQAIVDGVTWFWQDVFRVYLPRVMSMMKGIPIPRTEYSDAESELVLENLDISSFNLLPSHMFIRNITDIDIVAPAPAPDAPVQPQNHTQIGTLTHIRIQAIQLSVTDVSFFYKDKTAVLGPAEHSGRLSFTLPPKGIDVDLKMRLIPAEATVELAPVAAGAGSSSNVTPAGSLTNQPIPPSKTGMQTVKIPQRELHRAFHVVELLEVHIADEFEVDVKDSNHAIVLAMFKPILALRLKSALESFLATQLRSIVEGVDGWMYDATERAEKRAEVLKDAGLGGVGGGAEIAAGVWSEVGRMIRMVGAREIGRNGKYRDWRATGTGLVVEERRVNRETGEVQPGQSQFAVGAEPQILSGEKRGPDGTASESMEKRLKSATGQVLEDTGVNAGDVDMPDAMDVEQVVDQAKEVVQEGIRHVESFKDTVKMKADAERRRDGWQSPAFDVKA